MSDAIRWRVERSGTPSKYLPGWLALDPTETRGAWFKTHAEAVHFAHVAAAAELERNAKRGLLKLASRGAPAAGIPTAAPEVDAVKTRKRREYTRLTDEQIRAAVAMRTNGRGVGDIADALGVKKATLYAALRREMGRLA